jgi:hypothetical protein
MCGKKNLVHLKIADLKQGILELEEPLFPAIVTINILPAADIIYGVPKFRLDCTNKSAEAELNQVVRLLRFIVFIDTNLS